MVVDADEGSGEGQNLAKGGKDRGINDADGRKEKRYHNQHEAEKNHKIGRRQLTAAFLKCEFHKD